MALDKPHDETVVEQQVVPLEVQEEQKEPGTQKSSKVKKNPVKKPAGGKGLGRVTRGSLSLQGSPTSTPNNEKQYE